MKNALFGAAKLTKNPDIDKYKYSEYGIGFNGHEFFSHPTGGTGKNIIIFGVEKNSYSHVDHKGKYILVLGKGPTQGLHSLTAEKMCSINFTKVNTKFYLSLHYNGTNSYLFVNGTEIHKFKAKDSMIIPNNLCLGNVSKDFSARNMKKLGLIVTFMILVLIIIQLNWSSIDIKNIHKYLMKKNGTV